MDRVFGLGKQPNSDMTDKAECFCRHLVYSIEKGPLFIDTGGRVHYVSYDIRSPLSENTGAFEFVPLPSYK